MNYELSREELPCPEKTEELTQKEWFKEEMLKEKLSRKELSKKNCPCKNCLLEELSCPEKN